jgi:aspartate racemase
MTRRRTIGVLGGMGPLATVDLYRKIIENTPARTDQDHLPVLIDADPSVPDRTEALLHGGEDPAPWLIRGAKRLAGAGAAFIIIPCNTAHAFLDRVRPECPIPIIDMIAETARVASQAVPLGSSAGILATRGTIAAGLYQAALEARGLVPAIPDDHGQELLMQTIHSVKSGAIDDEAAAPALAAARTLEDGGAQALLAACTELPVVLRSEYFSVPLIDPTDVLARAAIRAATDDAAFDQLRNRAERVQDHVI